MKRTHFNTQRLRKGRYSHLEIAGKTIIFILLVLLAFMNLASEADAQGDKFSFRLRGIGQGLYGLVDDLYSDLSFNPSYINRFSGTTIYSNISNMQGKAEQHQFNQDDADFTLLRSNDIFPSNLLGTVTSHFGRPVGLFWESQGYNISLSDESNEEAFTSLTDGSKTGNRLNLGTDFSGNSFTYIGNLGNYGFSLGVHRLGFELNYDNQDYEEVFTRNDSTGLREITDSIDMTTRRTFKMPNNMISFSLGKVIKSGDTEYSIAGGRRPERVTLNAEDLFGLFKEPFFGGGEGKLSDLENKDLGYMELTLSTIFLNMRMKKINTTLNSLQQNSYLFKYERFHLPVSIEAIDESIQDSLNVSGISSERIITSRYGVSSGDGNGNLNNVEFGTGFERHINDYNTMIAMGAKFNYLWGDLDFKLNPGKLQETVEIDTEFGDPGEDDITVTTLTDNRTQITSGSIKGMFLTVPIGIETKLMSKLTLRLGARSVIPLMFKTEWETATEDGVDEVISEEDGIDNDPVDGQFPFNKFKKSNIDGKSINLDSYHFGARYEINDAIAIDLLHFAKLTELDTWWLSVVIRY
ncbi:hypothetical protein ACFL67_00910 [candidate division KSB1 bacterium]